MSTISDSPELAMRHAIAHHQAGRFLEAERGYRAVLATLPRHGDANHNLGLLLAQSAGADAALPHLELALTANPTHPQYLASCANALMDAGRAEEACRLLERGIESGADTADLRCNLGNAARLCNDPVMAERQFDLALQLDPSHVLAHYNLANLQEESGNTQQAIEHYRRALQLAPGFAEAGNNLGMLLHQTGRGDEAATVLVASLQARPDYIDAYRNLAVVLADAGRLEEAWQCQARAVELAPNDAGTRFKAGQLLTSLGRDADAAANFEAALAADPTLAEAHSNLGNFLHAQGRFAEAKAACERAIAVKPELFEAQLNLGNALLALGEMPESVAAYQRAIALRPDAAEAHYNLGNALMRQERAAEAADAYRAAISKDPQLAQAHDGLGNACKALGRDSDAIASHREAVRLKPDFAEAWSNLALDLQGHDRAEAETCCREALRLNPDLPEALVFMAELRSDAGEFKEAEHLLKRAIAISPNMAAALAGLALLRKMTPDDLSWLDAAEALLGNGLPPRQEVHLRFAVGKFLDDLGRYADAFASYRRANDLAKSLAQPYDAAREEREVERTCGIYTKHFLAARRNFMSHSTLPVFIVGMPRSGTSLAEQIIAAHPMAFGAGELPFWTSAAQAIDTATSDPAQLEQKLSAAAQDYIKLLQNMAPRAARVVDKMPANFRYLGLIHTALPQARIIHMRRNPIDTCLSIYFQHFGDAHPYGNDLQNLAHYYRQYERLMRHWRETIGPASLLDVPYEDLVQDQERWTRTMLEFIGLPWDPACLSFHKVQRVVGTASKWQVRQKMNQSSVERWRRYEAFIAPLLDLQS